MFSIAYFGLFYAILSVCNGQIQLLLASKVVNMGIRHIALEAHSLHGERIPGVTSLNQFRLLQYIEVYA